MEQPQAEGTDGIVPLLDELEEVVGEDGVLFLGGYLGVLSEELDHLGSVAVHLQRLDFENSEDASRADAPGVQAVDYLQSGLIGKYFIHYLRWGSPI